MILPSQRDRFDLPRDVCYLNAAYMTPLLRQSRDEGVEALERWSQPWLTTPERIVGDVDVAELRRLFAALIGADASGISVNPSVSYGLAVAAKNIPMAAGDTILVFEDQFPSNVYCWRRRADETGAKIITIPYPNDHDLTAAMLRAIKEVEGRLALIATANHHWATGAVIDLLQVSREAKERDAALVLDVTQSAGATPIDVAAIDPDFLACASYKWLLGPYTLAYLYVAPRWQTGIPLEEAWATRLGSSDFRRLVDYQDMYQPGAARFDMGARGQLLAAPFALNGLRAITEWGLKTLLKRWRRKTAYCRSCSHCTDLHRHRKPFVGRI